MILGRPTNLWNGLVVALVSLVSIISMQLFPDVDGELVATIGASVTAFLGTVILFVANGTPSVLAGGDVRVITPEGEDNYTTQV